MAGMAGTAGMAGAAGAAAGMAGAAGAGGVGGAARHSHIADERTALLVMGEGATSLRHIPIGLECSL